MKTNACNHQCQSCDQRCTKDTEIDTIKPKSKIRKIIGVMSGKGGVGKSMVTGFLATAANQAGIKTGIIDADITGPSIPQEFGIHDRITTKNELMVPCQTKTGINIISVNLMLNQTTDPVLWRGPVLAGMVKQFYQDTDWGETELLIVDLPPGTSDIPLTIFQTLPLTGVVIVTTPQDLVQMIVSKTVKMADKLSVPILAMIVNMASFTCPHCHQKSNLYQTTNPKNKKAIYLPFDPEWNISCDRGEIESLKPSPLGELAKKWI